MDLRFLDPAFLWLLLAVPLVWWRSGRFSGRHRALRAFVFSLLILALSRPILLTEEARPTHVFILDGSESVSTAAWSQAQRAVRELAAGPAKQARRLLVTLGREADDEVTKLMDQVISPGRGEGTPLARALALALRFIPDGAGGSITVATDGEATSAAWGESFEEMEERGIAFHVIPLTAVDRRGRIVGLDLEGEPRIGQTARVSVLLADVRTPATLHVMLGGEEVLRQNVPVGAGLIQGEFDPAQEGFQSLEAILGDGTAPGARLTRRVAVQGPLRIAYLGGRVEGSAEKLGALLGKGFELDPTADVQDASLLDDYDGVILDDRPAATLPVEWQEELSRRARSEGLGVFLSGGRAAFGPGGYHRTPVEDLAPVEFLQKEEKKDPSTTLAIIIDTSGSMVGNRMTIAKEVARLAMRRLEPHDKVGIVEFYGTKQWAAPIQSAANAIDLQRAINRLGAEGGTVLYPAVEEAYYALKNVETRFKHVLVLTDAGVETGPYETLLRKMSDDGITVSTVLVGPGRHSEFLVELADWGGGRYYNAPDRFNLPELMLKKPNTSALPAYRPGSVEVDARGSRGWWGGDVPRDLPPVEGYVETRPRPGAEVLMTVSKTKAPLLASWQYGLGRATALMTEPVGPGTKSWSQWKDYGRVLARVVAKTCANRQPPFLVETVRRGRRLSLIATRLRRSAGRPRVARMNGATEESAARDLKETAPGRFEGVFFVDPEKSVELVFTTKAVAAWRHRVCSDPLDARSPELQVAPGRRLDPSLAVRATGGTMLDPSNPSAGWAGERIGGGWAASRIWPWLTLAALFLYLTEILWRRLPRGLMENR